MSRSSVVVSWVLTLLLSVAAPIVVYQVATDRGVAEVPALLLSGIGPLVEVVLTALLRRRLDEIGVLVLAFVVIGLLTAALFDDPRLVLLRESVITGLGGLAFLATVPTSRPAMFLLGRRFATGGTPEGVVWWNGLWRFPEFRRTQRGMTAMWGGTFVVEAVVRAVLTYRLAVATMVTVNAIVPPAVIGVLAATTAWWARRAAAAGRSRAIAAGQPLGPPPA